MVERETKREAAIMGGSFVYYYTPIWRHQEEAEVSCISRFAWGLALSSRLPKRRRTSGSSDSGNELTMILGDSSFPGEDPLLGDALFSDFGKQVDICRSISGPRLLGKMVMEPQGVSTTRSPLREA